MSEKIISVRVPFPSKELAALASDVLNVDKVLRKNGITRDISPFGDYLKIVISGKELKSLRVDLNAILNNITLIAKTNDQFKN